MNEDSELLFSARYCFFLQFYEKYYHVRKTKPKLQTFVRNDIVKNDCPKHEYSTFPPVFDFSCLYNI